MTDASRLKRDFERIKKHREEKAAVSLSEREIFSKLKSDGFNPKALRRLLVLDGMKDREQFETDVDTYRVALGLAVEAVRSGDLSLREAGHEFGVSKSSIHRALAVPACPTAEMVEDDFGTAEPVREMTPDDLGDPLLVIDKDRGRFRDKVRTLAATIKPVIVEPVRAENAHTEIDLTIPDFLRRERAA